MKFVADKLSQANARISDDDKAQSTEQWKKGVKRKSNSTIKETNVSPPKKPLSFNPVQNAKKR